MLTQVLSSSSMSPARPRVPLPAVASEAPSAPLDRAEIGPSPALPAPRPAAAATAAVAADATPGPVGAVLRLILAGPPGAGKTTHGTAIAKAFGIPEISTGNLLRAEMKAGTELGKQIEPYMQRGDLVPIGFMAEVLEKRLSQPDAAKGFILDGLPRRPEDVDLLDRLTEKMGIAPIPMVLLDVPDSEIMGRVENRRVCDNQHTVDIKAHPPAHEGVCDQDGLPLKRRPDDEPEVVKHRLDVYHQETQPVIDAYAQRGLLFRVDGVGPIAVVSARALETARGLVAGA